MQKSLEDNSTAKETPRRPKRAVRRIAVLLVLPLAVVVAVVVMASQRRGLSDKERRLVGTWTWQDDPGETVLDFRDDGTMLYA